jgi:hypothetical protein
VRPEGKEESVMIRSTWELGLVFLLASASEAAEDGEKEARAVLDRAVNALGGEAKLKKLKAFVRKATENPTYRLPEDDSAITVELSLQFPDRFRHVLTRTARRGGKGTITWVVDGDKGWYSAGGETREVSKAELAKAKEDLYLEWVLRLYPLQDKRFKLTPLGNSTVNGKDAVGLKVSCKGHADVSLYFDKGTGLPLKCERPVEKPAEKVVETIFFEDYKEVDSIKYPAKRTIFHDRKKSNEETTVEFKPVEKLDEKLFTKP